MTRSVPVALLSIVALVPSCVSAILEPAIGADDEACEMQKTLLQTNADLRITKRQTNVNTLMGSSHLSPGAAPEIVVTSKTIEVMLAAVSRAKANLAHQPATQRSGAVVVLRQEACAVAAETEENMQIASLVPNNELVCYQGTQRELDRAYCLLQTAPTRALYRAADSPWFPDGVEVPANVEVELGDCATRGYDYLMHDPDDCWPPVQKWLPEENHETHLSDWEIAQGENWENYDEHFQVRTDFLDLGILLSGCICLPGSDVIDALQDICAEIVQEELLPISTTLLEDSSEAQESEAADVQPEEAADVQPEEAADVQPEEAADVQPEEAADVQPEESVAGVSRQEACAIADETEDNMQIASLVPNNELVCYQGTKRELDQVYCFLQQAPTRALYRAADSPWFPEGVEVPANVEVELGDCATRGHDFLLHDPDDCWAPVQKWLPVEDHEENLGDWEIAQHENWAHFDAYQATHGFQDVTHPEFYTGIFLSGCICLPGTLVMEEMHQVCESVEHMLPIVF